MDSRAAEPWAAEIDLTAERATQLVAKQFPELRMPSLTPLGEGWDNSAFVVNGAWVFRFPRRAVAAELIETESRILPLIAPTLPLPVPVPKFVGAATDSYPWPFLGYALLPGAPLSKIQPSDVDETALAAALGGFLRALHGIDLQPLVVAGLPGDTIGRLDHERMRPKAAERLDALHAAGLVGDANSLVAFLDRVAPSGPRSDRVAVVHADLYARHILLDDNLQAGGVIDWGDLHLGDPALDLAIAFSAISPPARDEFFDAYGLVDESTLELARYRAVYHSAMVAHYGMRIGDAELIAAGIRGLESYGD